MSNLIRTRGAPARASGRSERARYRRGVLHIRLPRDAAHKPRHIAVKRG